MNKLSLSDAKKQGLTRYFTGNPCPRGHVAERLVSTRACSQCAAEKKRLWNVQNPDKVNAQKRVWRDANLEKARALNLANQKLHRDSANARQRKYAERHRDRLLESRRIQQKENLAQGAAKSMRYHADKMQRMPAWANQDHIDGMYELAQVFRDVGLDVHVDHEIPLRGKRVSGLHVADNLQILNAQANRSKSNFF